jgi:hypothetical protein
VVIDTTGIIWANWCSNFTVFLVDYGIEGIVVSHEIQRWRCREPEDPEEATYFSFMIFLDAIVALVWAIY